MLVQTTLDTLNRLKLYGMASALSEPQCPTQPHRTEAARALQTHCIELHRNGGIARALLEQPALRECNATARDVARQRSRSGPPRTSSSPKCATLSWMTLRPRRTERTRRQ